MITDDTTMIEGRIIEDIIRRVKIIQNSKMFENHSMKREKRVDQKCQTAIRAGKMVTMQISLQQKTKEKHRR